MPNEIELHGGLDLAVIEPLDALSAKISKTDFVPAALRNKPEAVLACMLTGQELGISPMQSLRQIDIIEGRASLRAELMRALVLKKGHEIWFGEGPEFTTTRVACYGRRNGQNNVIRVEWNMDMAKAANLDRKNNWRAHPRAMLSARASSEVCRLLFPDIVAGMGYSREELEELEELEDGFIDDVVVDGQDIKDSERQATTKRTAPAAKKTTRKRATPATPKADIPEPALPDDDEEPLDVEIVEEPIQTTPSFDNGPKEPDEQTDDERIRSRQVVRLAKALKLDHHPVVAAVTNGVTESASRLSAEDAANVMDALRGISEGRLAIGSREGFPIILAKDEGPALPDDDVELDGNFYDAEQEQDIDDGETDDPEDWDSNTWRAFINRRDVKVTQIIRYVHSITPASETPVGSLQGLQGSGYASAVKKWVEQQ